MSFSIFLGCSLCYSCQAE